MLISMGLFCAAAPSVVRAVAAARRLLLIKLFSRIVTPECINGNGIVDLTYDKFIIDIRLASSQFGKAPTPDGSLRRVDKARLTSRLGAVS